MILSPTTPAYPCTMIKNQQGYVKLIHFFLMFIGLFFRSLTAPLRSVISMCYTFLYVYGIAVMTYQDGVFEDLHIYGMSPIGAIAWMAISGQKDLTQRYYL